MRSPSQSIKERVLAIVNDIPAGKILSYGQAAKKTGLIARSVGWIMSSLSDEEMAEGNVPWHRVIGAKGTIPALKYGFRGQEQIRRLVEEGWELENSRIKIV